MTKYSRKVNRRLLIVGEGEAECACLKHLKRHFLKEGIVVTIINAYGEGNVLKRAHKASHHEYHKRVIFLDTDKNWKKNKEKAENEQIEFIGSSQCLEGLLLSIHGGNPPDTSSACKDILKKKLENFKANCGSYDKHFPKKLLEEARSRIPELDKLLCLFEATWELTKRPKGQHKNPHF